MDTRRSFYLASRKDDFAEPAADQSTIDSTDIPYVMPANDTRGPKTVYRPAAARYFVV